MLKPLVQVEADVRAILRLQFSVDCPQLGKVVEELVKDHTADHCDDEEDIDNPDDEVNLVTERRFFYGEHGYGTQMYLPLRKVGTRSRMAVAACLGKVSGIDRRSGIRGGEDVVNPVATGAVCGNGGTVLVDQAVEAVLVTLHPSGRHAVFPIDFFRPVTTRTCGFGYFRTVNGGGGGCWCFYVMFRVTVRTNGRVHISLEDGLAVHTSIEGFIDPLMTFRTGPRYVEFEDG